MTAPAAVSVRYPVYPKLDAWVLPEGKVPESVPHDAATAFVRALLQAWAVRSGRDVRVARNLAVRWLEDAPAIGIDPDVCVVSPAPPDFDHLGSLCTWKPGHHPPPLCIEIVSKNHPYKDYADIQDRYAALGARELIVFDPLLAGPPSLGGPVALQLWRRDAVGLFERLHFGAGPVYSEFLDAWFHADGEHLRIADDHDGTARWLTLEERERTEKERERAARLDAERRLAELERRLR